MIKQTPSIGRILAMVAFTLSCFGILVFLWLSFGGSVPLQPKGYRVTVEFPEATQLAQEADVRISGVQRGQGEDARAERADRAHGHDARDRRPLRAAPARHARDPAAEDAAGRDLRGARRRATRRRGLLAGRRRAAERPGGDTVELDEILRTFDPVTRQRFSTWFDQQGIAARGRADEHQRGARAT